MFLNLGRIPSNVFSVLLTNFTSMYFLPQGADHKLRIQEKGGRLSKKSTSCKLLYHIKCKRRGVGGQKKTNLVNLVCERPPISNMFVKR